MQNLGLGTSTCLIVVLSLYILKDSNNSNKASYPQSAQMI